MWQKFRYLTWVWVAKFGKDPAGLVAGVGRSRGSQGYWRGGRWAEKSLATGASAPHLLQYMVWAVCKRHEQGKKTTSHAAMCVLYCYTSPQHDSPWSSMAAVNLSQKPRDVVLTMVNVGQSCWLMMIMMVHDGWSSWPSPTISTHAFQHHCFTMNSWNIPILVVYDSPRLIARC